MQRTALEQILQIRQVIIIKIMQIVIFISHHIHSNQQFYRKYIYLAVFTSTLSHSSENQLNMKHITSSPYFNNSFLHHSHT